ncbi:MAG TPA: dTDP-4-dehydrorhamnose reductase [Erwinia persicina]|uniref:dTDP-4-dehydrorhamnose reductase n=1 Tax=Erwinia persicina TaxID=55211 RepID=A0A4U3EY49_9GAMM|nr:dTDP-4-dehydrorhamnose reductase [Erwinia persicina]MBD8107976.1 dTDP-4-dehydrorhamnose reductase [Erwinia persicina]MBD8211056.1 dTDP-4-dehydrorhamnose reductase [Erwinia persicina]MCQ4095250.1 dTDP-4-dehydrorhamnose reductase [Erwinia persicina]MCQ4102962.1 dTDP-4-dehydrorhamnose reductase [Erwinia persicina]QZQ51879.1 dTDP-4-dehydrorhamnose reductase [Erwinia persicina]
MRVLMTGADGQLGRCLSERLPAWWVVRACNSQQLDITRASMVSAMVTEFQPTVIINCAAWTAVDKAETDPQQAMAVNATGAANLAAAASESGARLLHISTDYVFDGNRTTPWREDDIPAPLNVYGMTKWQGEKNIQALLPQAIIVRTSWVFSEYGQNFVKTMMRLAQSHDCLSVIADQVGCPTYAGDLAECLIALAQHPDAHGIYHYCGDSAVSWFEFSEAIFALMKSHRPEATTPQVNAISAAEYSSAVQRPAMSVLDCQRIENLGIVRSDWQRALRQVVDPPHF